MATNDIVKYYLFEGLFWAMIRLRFEGYYRKWGDMILITLIVMHNLHGWKIFTFDLDLNTFDLIDPLEWIEYKYTDQTTRTITSVMIWTRDDVCNTCVCVWMCVEYEAQSHRTKRVTTTSVEVWRERLCARQELLDPWMGGA